MCIALSVSSGVVLCCIVVSGFARKKYSLVVRRCGWLSSSLAALESGGQL